MLHPWLFIGFIGHRHLADPDRVAARVNDAMDRIAALSPGPLAAVSSLASGADTLFVEAALARGLLWTLLLPFPVEDFRTDFTPADWARAEKLLPSAVRTHVEPRGESRDECFLECAIRTIEESDVLIAVWDGAPARGQGGTGDGVAQARALKKPLIWIHAVTGEVMAGENLDRLPARPAPAGPVPPPTADTLDATLAHHDRIASAQQPAARHLTRALILLHQAATIIAIAALVWSHTDWLTGAAPWVKLGVLALALWLPRRHHRSHDGWITHRVRAELCRSARALWNLRHPDEVFPALRLPVETTLQRGLLLLRHLAPPAPLDLAAARADYLARRIDDQLAYFRAQTARAVRQRRLLKRLATGCTLGAIACGLSVGLFLSHEAAAYAPLKFLALTLPLVAAAFLANLGALDLERRVARFSEITAFLADARERVANAATWAGLNRVVLEVERTLLLEIWEWLSLQRFSARH